MNWFVHEKWKIKRDYSIYPQVPPKMMTISTETWSVKKTNKLYENPRGNQKKPCNMWHVCKL